MFAAVAVLTNRMLVPFIFGFTRGLPYALLKLELEGYAAEAAWNVHGWDDEAGGDHLLRHALVAGNADMVDRLFRMHGDSNYGALAQFRITEVLELVCQRGSVKALQALNERRDVPTEWPANLLYFTIEALDRGRSPRSPEAQTAFADHQKSKAFWLMEHHPEACTKLVTPEGALLSSLEHREFLLKLLAPAGLVDLPAFGVYGGRLLDVSLAELLLHEYPTAITPKLISGCCAYGNLAAVRFFHDHDSELPPGCFTKTAMHVAAVGGYLDVVRFLHDHRSEGCTTLAMNLAAIAEHLDVVKFLRENRTEGCPSDTIEDVQHGRLRNAAVVEYLVKHYPELVPDPSSWQVNDAVKVVQAAWAKSAIHSENDAVALRAAVIHLTDLDEFKRIHARCHLVACAHWFLTSSLLQLAIEWEKDAFAVFLVENCEQARDSIGWATLEAAGSQSRPMNHELLDLLLANCTVDKLELARHMGSPRDAYTRPRLAFVQALLEHGVPCTESSLVMTLCGDDFSVAAYLMDRYPELITTQMLSTVASQGEHEYLHKLCASHTHLVDGSVVDAMLRGSKHVTWKMLRFLHARFPNVTLGDLQLKLVWCEGLDNVLAFMWLVWRGPKIATSLAEVKRSDRLRLYSRLRACVPSLFEDVPRDLPWCYQLRFLRERVESGELTLEDVEGARIQGLNFRLRRT